MQSRVISLASTFSNISFFLGGAGGVGGVVGGGEGRGGGLR